MVVQVHVRKELGFDRTDNDRSHSMSTEPHMANFTGSFVLIDDPHAAIVNWELIASLHAAHPVHVMVAIDTMKGQKINVSTEILIDPKAIKNGS